MTIVLDHTHIPARDKGSNGGRGFYFRDLEGHVIELLTAPNPSV